MFWLLFLLFPLNAFAGQMEVAGQMYTYDDALSNSTFVAADLSEYDFSNKTVYASIFAKQEPTEFIFAPGTQNVTFVCCQLDNAILPNFVTVVNPGCGSHRMYKTMEDGQDWIIDEQGNPVRLLNE